MAICIEINCKIRSSFNFINDVKPLYCYSHKKDGMINVKDKRCIENSCITRPIYNYKGNKNGVYCFKHKKDDMINVKDKLCTNGQCKVIANYNYKNTHNALYCSTHKMEGMINVRKKFCIEQDCMTEPTYNYKDIKTPIYCLHHKKNNMINVKNKRCIADKCTIIPVYNYEGESMALYCVKHKLDGMVDIKSKKCNQKGCNILASYNYEHLTKCVYCDKHKLPDMINIKTKHKRCKTPMCDTLATIKQYEGYCLFCFIHLFPDKTQSRNYKTKENDVTYFIKESFKHITIIYDKKIKDGCSNRRPDIFIDLGYQVIIVEIDEDQHDIYDSICENKRIMLLSQDIGYRPLIFIRFNPDQYINSNGENIKSCWSKTKSGLYKVNHTKQTEWNERLNELKNTITYWIDHKTEKTISFTYLFYNDYK